MGRETSCLDVETRQSHTLSYDVKGRVHKQTDPSGNLITHTYDYFGNRLTTHLPKAQGSEGEIYTPVFRFGYDIQGNLTTSQMPQGETTHTRYSLLRKPVHILQPNGTKTRHFYYKNGTLAKTILPDLTEFHYQYDLFQRMISKIVYSREKEILSLETWEYDAFQLQAYQDPRGLITRFFYDGSGRKIGETAEERKILYSYDALGYLERVDQGAIAHVQKYNAGGFVEKQWEKDATGRVENEMHFFYDAENRKERAVRFTS